MTNFDAEIYYFIDQNTASIHYFAGDIHLQ